MGRAIGGLVFKLKCTTFRPSEEKRNLGYTGGLEKRVKMWTAGEERKKVSCEPWLGGGGGCLFAKNSRGEEGTD